MTSATSSKARLADDQITAGVDVGSSAVKIAVMLTTGVNDPRVDPWEAAKMTARLQAATSSSKPILLRVDYDAGHGFGSGKAQRNELVADQFSFLLWQFGDPEFQATKWKPESRAGEKQALK